MVCLWKFDNPASLSDGPNALDLSLLRRCSRSDENPVPSKLGQRAKQSHECSKPPPQGFAAVRSCDAFESHDT
jgi:hypothetical protein